MATASLVALLVVALFATSVAASSNANPDDTRKPYIVHMLNSMKPHPFTLHEHWYASLLRGVSGSQSDANQLLYTYHTVLHGFAAKLSSAEARALERMDGTLAVIPSSSLKIHTTRSPVFLGLSTSFNGLWSLSNYGKDVIVGVVDTGIWPESSSFRDEGLGPVPSKWKGVCQSGVTFNSSNCNKKIIGARYFIKGFESKYGPLNESTDYRSPRDAGGHGTHTASTVAGSAVPRANLLDFANGTAIGMAPQARLAIYKVIWGVGGGADGADMAAAMDQAVEDGVDILSVSLGQSEFDEMAIAAFGAMKKGVFVSMAASNDGPFTHSLQNTAPWVITVGASNIDREFPAPVILGNLETHRGSSLYRGVGIEKLPLVYASHTQSSKRCHVGTLHPDMVKGKIVLCDQGFYDPANEARSDSLLSEKGIVVKEAGGAGMIVANERVYGAEEFWNIELLGTDLPATIVSFRSGQKIKAYIESTRTPTATINPTGSTVVGKSRAPMVAAFSSRGPSTTFPEILKPDVIAPGVNILAAYSPARNGWKEYDLESGTSMSCPHVSGVAALIRAVHPSWSPAAVKSALMTSSYLHDNNKQLIQDEVTLKPADAFAMGAGHINPRAAVDPGLVYDLTPQDYIDFLCSVDPNKTEIGLITRKNESSLSCPNPKLKRLEAGDLNYPSFSVLFDSRKSVHVKRRTVTNVGAKSVVYKALVKSPMNVNISVEPHTLEFNGHNAKLSFSVRFESLVNGSDHTGQEFGHIAWKCVRGGKHLVRSPVAIRWLGKKN